MICMIQHYLAWSCISLHGPAFSCMVPLYLTWSCIILQYAIWANYYISKLDFLKWKPWFKTISGQDKLCLQYSVRNKTKWKASFICLTTTSLWQICMSSMNFLLLFIMVSHFSQNSSNLSVRKMCHSNLWMNWLSRFQSFPASS